MKPMKGFPGRLLWIGEQNVHPVVIDRRHDFVMDSVIHYYRMREPMLRYEPGKLFLDSGAFTAAMRNLDLDRERVVHIQERLSPDLAIPLDYPLKPGMSVGSMRKSWAKTRANIVYWQENSSLSSRIVPTLHSWDRQSLIRNVNWLAKNVDSEYLAIGVVVNPDFSGYTGFFKDRQPRRDLIKMLAKAIKLIGERTDFKVHVMGLGSSPLMLHLAYYLGVESTDSAGYRRKAAFGKIVLPGTGERYVGNKYGGFGRKYLSKHEFQLLSECSCVICSSDQSKLWTDWVSRAIHNEHVMKSETERARELLSYGLDVYEAYLDKIFTKSKHGLEYLWRYAKLLRKYGRLELS